MMTNTVYRYKTGKLPLETPPDDLRAMFDLFDGVMALSDDSGEAAATTVEQGAILIVAQLIARKIDHRMGTRQH
jgi:hypothetical protein